MKIKNFIRVALSSLWLLAICCFGLEKIADADQGDSMGKAFQQGALENQGRELLKQGLYDEALTKFQAADDPSLKLKGFQDTVAKLLIRKAYYLKGEYEKSLDVLNPLVQENPEQSNWQDEKSELEALIRVRDTQTRAPIDQFIASLKIKYRKYLPPQKYEINVTTGVASDFIRSYDQIGDYDGGIAFLDGILEYWEKKSGQDLHRPGNTNQYFLVRQAFEQDKNDGKKGCMGRSGCVGRATIALIQSDYFPW